MDYSKLSAIGRSPVVDKGTRETSRKKVLDSVLSEVGEVDKPNAPKGISLKANKLANSGKPGAVPKAKIPVEGNATQQRVKNKAKEEPLEITQTLIQNVAELSPSTRKVFYSKLTDSERRKLINAVRAFKIKDSEGPYEQLATALDEWVLLNTPSAEQKLQKLLSREEFTPEEVTAIQNAIELQPYGEDYEGVYGVLDNKFEELGISKPSLSLLRDSLDDVDTNTLVNLGELINNWIHYTTPEDLAALEKFKHLDILSSEERRQLTNVMALNGYGEDFESTYGALSDKFKNSGVRTPDFAILRDSAPKLHYGQGTPLQVKSRTKDSIVLTPLKRGGVHASTHHVGNRVVQIEIADSQKKVHGLLIHGNKAYYQPVKDDENLDNVMAQSEKGLAEALLEALQKFISGDSSELKAIAEHNEEIQDSLNKLVDSMDEDGIQLDKTAMESISKSIEDKLKEAGFTVPDSFRYNGTEAQVYPEYTDVQLVPLNHDEYHSVVATDEEAQRIANICPRTELDLFPVMEIHAGEHCITANHGPYSTAWIPKETVDVEELQALNPYERVDALKSTCALCDDVYRMALRLKNYAVADSRFFRTRLKDSVWETTPIAPGEPTPLVADLYGIEVPENQEYKLVIGKGDPYITDLGQIEATVVTL